ncbi:hypothetical protein SAMN05192554_101257 [Haloarchaeobius iranensis]|uniref:Uncharacterized protein n=1 Tax=Haloarchaeobius iranensis TaxID=996166 RepID=A0A1G9SLP4_9EURY|nr:hypothetical protein SAMN05192554_101257 [Haloarchaeobius iranensis]
MLVCRHEPVSNDDEQPWDLSQGAERSGATVVQIPSYSLAALARGTPIVLVCPIVLSCVDTRMPATPRSFNPNRETLDC